MGTGLFSKLKLTDKIILSFLGALAISEDILNQISTPKDIIKMANGWDAGYRKTLKKASLEQAFLRILAKKYLEVEETERIRRYKVSREGWEYLYQRFPQIRLNQKNFDGFWRFVVYDIAEEERKMRNRIRSGLRLLGFRMIQKSVWASPYDWEDEIDSLFKKLEITDHALVLKSKLSKDKTEMLLKDYWPDLQEQAIAGGRDASKKAEGEGIVGLLSPASLPESLVRYSNT